MGPQTENPQITKRKWVRKLQTRKLPHWWKVRKSNKFLLIRKIADLQYCGSYLHLQFRIAINDKKWHRHKFPIKT
jgi:hypothetical protein